MVPLVNRYSSALNKAVRKAGDRGDWERATHLVKAALTGASAAAPASPVPVSKTKPLRGAPGPDQANGGVSGGGAAAASEDGPPSEDLTYALNSAMMTCAKGRRWGEATELFRAALAAGVEPDARGFNVALDACARSGHHGAAMGLLDAAIARGLADSMTYALALSSCQRGGRWKEALRILRLMGTDPLTRVHEGDLVERHAASGGDAGGDTGGRTGGSTTASTASAAATIGSNGDSGGGGRGGEALQRSRQPLVSPNARHWNAAISACGKGGAWEAALELLEEMLSQPPGSSGAPTVVSYGA